MENMEYYKVLGESLKLGIEDKILIIYNLMIKVVFEVGVAIEKEENLMMSPSVNHKTLDILEIYSKMLCQFSGDDLKTDINANANSRIMSEAKKISIEEKIMVVYNLIESIKLCMLGEFSNKFKLEDFGKSRSIEINKTLLEASKIYIQEYSNAIKGARVLENRVNEQVNFETSGAYILR